MTGRNPWEVLGVAEGTPRNEVLAAFRRRAKETHPDHGGAAAEFAALVEAFDTVRGSLPRPRRCPTHPTPYDAWLRPSRPVRVWPEAGSSTPDHAATGPAPGAQRHHGGSGGGSPAVGEFARLLDGELARAGAASPPV